MPSILFIHENFPAQFGGIASYLAHLGWRVVYATAAEHVPADGQSHALLPGVQVVGYRRARDPSDAVHPYLKGTETAVLNAQAFARVGAGLMKGGFTPDIVVAHSGWGSGSLARVVWPNAKFVQYLEWWYQEPALDAEPGTVPANPEDRAARTLCRNLPFLLDAQSCDAILVPTKFQAAQIPDYLQSRVTILHDGIDSGFFSPAPRGAQRFTHEGIPDGAPIVTYATRGMEPLRGFPQFMTAWAKLQKLWPNAHCVVAGRDCVSYGAQLPNGDSFKTRALRQHKFDTTRLHFVGPLRKDHYRDLLRRTNAHVYLTRPFVLSWSMIESMMTGVPLVASDTPPVREAAAIGTVSAVNMDDPDQIVSAVSRLLKSPKDARKQGKAARQHARELYAADRMWPKLNAFYSALLPDARLHAQPVRRTGTG